LYELLNPAGLAWLAAVPLLLVPYLIRQNPRRRIVAALFLYEGIEPAQRTRLGGRLELRPLVWLQLLFLLAAVAAIVRPAFRWTEVRSAIVLDDSASLAASEGSGESRFAAAVAKAREAIGSDPANTWDVFALSPTPHEIATGVSPANAAARVAAVSVTRCAHPDDSIVRSFFDRLAAEGYSHVHVVSDRGGASSERFSFSTVGTPRPNIAITAFGLTPAALAGQAALLEVTVQNFSPRAARIPIALRDGAGKEIRAGRIDVAAHATASFATEVTTDGPYEATIDARDALGADDRATIATRRGGGNVLVVAADPAALGPLERTLGVRLETVTPERYRPSDAIGRDLVIFHRSAPKDAPATAALYVLPPDAAFLPHFAGRVSSPTIAFPAATHPVARYLNPAAIRPRQVLTLADDASWQPIAAANGGTVIVARSEPFPSVVSGIDLFPYLGDRNRPMSILTLNLVSWMLRGAPPGGDACGVLGALESDLEHPKPLPAPSREAAAAKPATKSRPFWPALTLGALALVLLEALFHRERRVLPWLVRLIVVALLVAASRDPERAQAATPPPPAIVADVSRSFLPQAREHALAAVGAGRETRVTAFATRPVPTTAAELASSASAADADQTDIEGALFAAAGDAPEGGPLFLLTDGWETIGDARRAFDALVRKRVRVYPIAERQPIANDVAVVSLSLPFESPAGAAAQAAVVLKSDNPGTVSGRLVVRQGAKEVWHQDVRVPPGESVVAKPVLVTGEGLLEFSAEFLPTSAATDSERDDDVAKAWIAVGGGKRVLLIARDQRSNRELEATLRGRGFRVTSVARAAGEPVPDVSAQAAVVLNDVPLSDLPASFPETLRERVRGGGGLVMVGGTQSFGLGGYRGTPIEEALPVRMKERRHDEPRNSVALVIDKSGSMREERRIVYAREAARQLVDHLKDRDRITVIGFDREPFIILPLSDVGEIRDDFDRQIERLRPVGGTRLYPALVEARRQLLGEEAKRRHIIVLSDGLSEDAETSSGRRQYYDLALALSEQNVTISTVALGHEADSDFLERLASFGRGAFHATEDAASLPEIVLGEFEQQHAKEKTLAERDVRPEPSTDSPLVGVIARAEPSWPSVSGFVETELKPEARRDVGIADSDSPLIASWQFGRGRAVAVTTDADGRWSDRWLRWNQWSRLWNEIANWLTPETRAEQARFAVAVRDGALEVDYSRFDQDPGGALTAKVTGPKGFVAEAPFTRLAVGHYRARFETHTPGDYRIEIKSARGPVTEAPLGYTMPRSETAEQPRRDPNWPLLEELARRTGGAVNPAVAEIVPAPAGETVHPLAPWILGGAMLVFLLELVLRRMTSAR
jgi:Mg-chelatase subunit ChlD